MHKLGLIKGREMLEPRAQNPGPCLPETPDPKLDGFCKKEKMFVKTECSLCK
jgi:hypothetical protein